MGAASPGLKAAEKPPRDTQAQKLQAVGRLTAGVSHDFNNLLQTLRHTLELARTYADDPQAVRRWAESGLRQVDRGSRLTAQLLSFSAARVQRPQAVAVAPLLQELQDTLQRTLGPVVRVWVPGGNGTDPGHVRADAAQLESALLNLAFNARDAMPGGGQLSLSAEAYRSGPAGLAGGPYVAISVADTGTGMSAEIRERAFEPFYTTKAVGQGSGLGLSQVYGFALQSGGRLSIEASGSRGTTVVLWLPACEALALEPPAPHAASVGVEPAHPRIEVGVVIADADAYVRRGICDGLRSLGWRAVPALDGLAALAALDRHAPASMVIDLAMPGIGGLELGRLALQARPDLAVVYTDTDINTDSASDTNTNRQPTVHDRLPVGARVLQKPFDIDALGRALNAELDVGGARLRAP